MLRCSTMEQIGVRELRQQASRYLRRVEAGESFLVTDYGRPVAVLASTIEAVRAESDAVLERLVEAGSTRRSPRCGRRRGSARSADGWRRDPRRLRRARPTTKSRSHVGRVRAIAADRGDGLSEATSGGGATIGRRRPVFSRRGDPGAAHGARGPATRTIETSVRGPDRAGRRHADDRVAFDNATVSTRHCSWSGSAVSTRQARGHAALERGCRLLTSREPRRSTTRSGTR